MGAGNVFLLLGLRLHLALVGILAFPASAEADAVHQNVLKVTLLAHSSLFTFPFSLNLVVEQSYTREGHGDAVLVAGHDDMVIANAAASLGNVLNATLVSALNIVAEGEEGVAA